MSSGETETVVAATNPRPDPLDAALRELAAAPAVKQILADGEVVGSFTVERELGRGGMGAVYLAWDNELERHVALKVQRGHPRSDSVQRMAREARVMAQLSHPNVLPVHEVGEHEGRLFIAMEYVKGGTAKQWQRRGERSPDEIVALYVQAGRGLAAAHDMGLVHRDFKPDNVLVGDDGRARVADFGLARVTGADSLRSAPSPSIARDPGTLRRSASLPEKLTQTGARVGTTLYMAPEQHAGLDVDARADQFSFCVSLFEALYGHRPFTGKTAAELLRNIHVGAIAEPENRTTPRRVWTALRRGLRSAPADRFPPMAALLAALQPRPPAKTAVLVIVPACLAAAAVLGVVLMPSEDPPCEGAGHELTALWDADARTAARNAVAGVGKAYADEVFERVNPRLTAYATRWGDAYAAACEATHVRETQSLQILELRAACLDRGRHAFASLVRELDDPRPADVIRLVERVGDLPSVPRCSDLDALRRIVPLPDDPGVREQIRHIAARVEDLPAESEEPEPALAAASALVEDAEATGHMPVIARARFGLAVTQHHAGDPAAPTSARRAFDDALAAGDDSLAAHGALLLLSIEGFARQANALRWADTARALMRRLAHAPLLRAKLLLAEAQVRGINRDYLRATALLTEASQILEDVDPQHATLADVHAALGRTAARSGDPAAGEEHLQAALDVRRVTFGAHHPSVGALLADIGRTRIGIGDFAGAEENLTQARAVFAAAFGPEHVSVARVEVDLADCVWAGGDDERALRMLTHAVPVLREAPHDEPLLHVEAVAMQGSLLRALGRHAEAIQVQTEVADDPAVAADPEKHSFALRRLGKTLLHAGQLEHARTRFEASLAVLDAAGLDVGRPIAHLGLAEIAAAEQRYSAVLEHANVVVARLSKTGAIPPALARARLFKAKALRAQGDGPAARAAAERALVFLNGREDQDSRDNAAEARALLDEL